MYCAVLLHGVISVVVVIVLPLAWNGVQPFLNKNSCPLIFPLPVFVVTQCTENNARNIDTYQCLLQLHNFFFKFLF